MLSYGYHSDHINLIADNLRDRYKSGFPILKELIQNADDAKARRLVFGMHSGFKSQSSHPLLQGTGLWVFNDGQFKKEDERAIHSFGLNSKAGESGSIGKFGLGMKSVFHLCEAFFYVAFDGQRHFGRLLNPWHDPDGEDLFHRSWDEANSQESDALRMIVTENKLDKDCKSWFLLWIPLRRRDHVPQKNGKPYGGIVDKYPGEGGSNEMQFLSDWRLSRKIRSVVPLLRNLESIELANSEQIPGFKVQISFDEGMQRVDHRSAELVSTGSVSDGASKGKLRFRVQQKTLPGVQPFTQFQKLDVWPKTGRLNSDGIREPVPDKSEAEGAVLVSGASANGDEAKLVIDWAVFLPMEEGLSYEFHLDKSLHKSLQQYRIVLHGQFFVDSGRRGIAGFGHLADKLIEPSSGLDDADLHTGWNQSLAQKVILPQLLPTLAQFANDLNDIEKEELARAILSARSKSSATGVGKGFWENFRDFVCHEQAWVRLITPEGLKWSHEKITHVSRLLKLPRPPKHDLERTWKVLPRLKKLVEEGCLLIDEEAPSLMRTHSDWDAVTLLDVLDGVDFEEACSETGMSYLISFLSPERYKYVNVSEIQRELVVLLRSMLQREPIKTFRGFRSTFQGLVSLVKADYRFAVGTKTTDTVTGLDDSTLELLMGTDTEKLLIPMDLDPEDASKGKPTDSEIRNLLKTIDQEISRHIDSVDQGAIRQVENLLRAAQAVLNLLNDKKDERGQAIRVNRSLRVLTATCARVNKSMAVSFDELQSAHRSGLLFKRGFGNGTAAYPVAIELAKLLPDKLVWVVDTDIASWVQRGEQDTLSVPTADDGTAAYVTLGKNGRKFVLADMKTRSHFIRTISPSAIKGDDVIRGMRYVLHDSASHNDDVDTTLWINADRTDEVWIKLKCMVEPDSWNVVNSNLAGAIKSDDWEKLRIRKVGPDEVIEHMRQGSSVDQIDASQLTKGEITQILSRIDDEKLWKSIPLHRDTAGSFGPIDENCYVDSQRLTNQSFLNGVRLIDPIEDSKLSEKQKNWIPIWTHETTIERVLAVATPGSHWKLILDAVGSAGLPSSEKICKLMKKTSWLPIANGSCIKPEDIIDFDSLADDIDRLASECDYCYAGISAISPEVKKHASFPKIKPLFANDKEGLERLGQLMAEAGQSVGDILWTEKYENLIEQLAELKALPAWAIVRKVINILGDSGVAKVKEHLLKEIQKPLSVAKLVEILNEISAQNNPELRVVFNLYLEQLAKRSDDLPVALSKIQLLARDGKWKSAKALCVGVQGVAKGSVLHDEQAQILAAFFDRKSGKQAGSGDQNTSASVPDDVSVLSTDEKARAILVNYFKPWRELMPSGPVGAFFALLGPSFRSLAAEWLKPHSFDYFADQLGWVEPGSRNSPVWDYKRREHTKLEALEMLDFLPTISNSKEIEVVSLLGDDIRVPVDSEIDGLVMGNLTFAGTRNGKSFFQLRLREVNQPEQYDKAALSNMLRKTCECILREAYNQREPNLGLLWKTLEKSNQLELAVARGLILDSLPYDLSKLKSAKKNSALSEWQAAFKKLKSSRAEKNEAKQATDQVEKAIAEAKSGLSKLMTSDPQVQESVLNGIRERVEQNQYEVSSIAFELLQNADDAVTELQRMMRDDSTVAHPSSHVGRFVVQSDGDTFRFLHWGRPVNYMGYGNARNESYGEDLQRMLILAASDKEDAANLTGKFGLGFKSVLLATDAPCLFSGDLKVKIVGGCLPTEWLDASGASDSLKQHGLPDATGLRGTAVEFKVNSDEKRSQVLDRFSALAGLQCIFSKEIRSIQINETIHQWRPTPLADDLPDIEIGRVQLPVKGGLSSSRMLNFRMTDGCFALRVGSRGFVRFQEEVDHFPPGVWVTAPTREPAASGLILNSQFELDTGRGGLPHGESARSNLDKAEQLGSVAADLVLQATLRSRGDWEQVKSQLQLAKGITASEFWATFWEQIPLRKNDDSESIRLLSQFGHRLLERFVDIAGEIPNGLSGPLSAFVDPAQACLALNPRWQKLCEPLSKWSEFANRFPVSGWISVDVRTQLKAVSNSGDVALEEVSVQLLLDLVPHKRCSAELMGVLYELLGELSLEEIEIVKERMGNFGLQAKDGSWKSGRQLLKADGCIDQQFMRFAPSSSILHPSYKQPGLALLQKYAGFEKPQANVVADWILAVPSKLQVGRVEGLRYLLRDHDVRSWIEHRIHGSWIAELKPSSPYLTDFSIPDKNQLLVMFNPEPAWETADPEEPPSELLNGGEALEAIRDWWRENSAEQLKKFDRNFWPDHVPRQFDGSSDHRGSWMTLFAIGLMQRHGRVGDQQNRGFIDKMQSKGFWDVFCHIDPRSDGQAWLNVLNEYGEQQNEDEQYSMWMDNFPRLYRLARWLDVYVQVFQGLDYRERSQISDYLSPNADPEMSGSGIQAPTMRGSLRLGQHVVIRELLRCGVLKGETAKAWAFKPGDAVKKMLLRIGFDDLTGEDVSSKDIHDVLRSHLGDDATFDGAYDIPLLILTRDQELQQKILGITVTYVSEIDGE